MSPDLGEHLVSILIFVEEHSNIGLVSPSPLQLAKLAVHCIHIGEMTSDLDDGGSD
jgi:hypothetical protein